MLHHGFVGAPISYDVIDKWFGQVSCCSIPMSAKKSKTIATKCLISVRNCQASTSYLPKKTRTILDSDEHGHDLYFLLNLTIHESIENFYHYLVRLMYPNKKGTVFDCTQFCNPFIYQVIFECLYMLMLHQLKQLHLPIFLLNLFFTRLTLLQFLFMILNFLRNTLWIWIVNSKAMLLDILLVLHLKFSLLVFELEHIIIIRIISDHSFYIIE